MTTKEIKALDYNEIQDILQARGITGTYRSGNDDFAVWVTLKDGSERPATDEETELHVQAVWSYHMEEAQAGLL